MGCGTSNTSTLSSASLKPPQQEISAQRRLQLAAPPNLSKKNRRREGAASDGKSGPRRQSSSSERSSITDMPLIRDEEIVFVQRAEDTFQQRNQGFTMRDQRGEGRDKDAEEWKSFNDVFCDSPVPFTAQVISPSGSISASAKARDSSCLSAAGDEFAAEGSSSTARLSVYSGSSTDGAALPTTRPNEPRLAFFSASMMAPHAPHDAMELQKRLAGGYTDLSSGITYLTPKQRWEVLLQETRTAQEIPKPPPCLSGAGILWLSLADGRGLPAPLPAPTPRAAAGLGNQHLWRQNQENQFRQKMLQEFWCSVSASLPIFEEEEDTLGDCEMAIYTIQRCAIRVKEFYTWCLSVNPNHFQMKQLATGPFVETPPFSPNYQRLKTILGQLQISLRDTAILLEDPKRYLEAFARIDPQGLMFQAEVLSLQDERVRMTKKSQGQDGCRAPDPWQGALRNPLQERFLEQSSALVDAPLRLTKARDVLSLMISLDANQSNSSSDSHSGSCASSDGSNEEDSQLQLLTALRLIQLRAFKRLRYISLILRNAVEIEIFEIETHGTIDEP